MPVSLLESKQRMGAIGTFDLSQTFQYDELTINMKQKNDETYAKILNRLRVGHITPADCTLLREKLIAQNKRATKNKICDRYLKLEHAGKSPLVLLPTTVLCDEINSAMLDRIGNTIHNLDAIDILETIVEKSLMPKIKKAYQKVETDTTRTAGLEKSLRLCVGARVMLKRNKDVDAGLVNGSVKIVQDFSSSEQNSTVQIHSVKVKFQNLNFAVQIQRESCSFQVLNGIFYTRKQFPLMLVFGIMVHKFQGLSLDSVIVDAGPATFGCGMVYVALSRVTTLHSLHLVDLDETKIKCDTKAANEYNRLRDLYTPHLGHLGPAEADTQKESDKKKTTRTTSSTNRKQVDRSTSIFYSSSSYGVLFQSVAVSTMRRQSARPKVYIYSITATLNH